MRGRLAVIGAAAMTLAAGCSGGAHHQAAPASTLAPPTTAINPAGTPSTITAAYVDAVLVQLNHVYGNAVRSEVLTKQVTPAAIQDLRAIYSGPLYTSELSAFREGESSQPSDVRDPPGDEATNVVQMLSSSRSCIFARASTSYAAVLRSPSTEAAA